MDFYVYVHARKDTGSIFYVGKGRNGRAWYKHGRNEYWNRVVKKHGFTVTIIRDGMTERDALDLEIDMISRIGRDNLCNLTDGGEGLSGYSPTEETREKMRVNSTGRRHSMEARSKMGVSLKRKVYCSNGMIFEGVSDAVKWLICMGKMAARQSVISRCASGDRISAYGLSWSYFGPCAMPSKDEIKNISRMKISEAKRGKPALNRTPVIRSDGKMFDSMESARKYLSLNGFPKADKTAICRCCRGKSLTAYGYGWRYEK